MRMGYKNILVISSQISAGLQHLHPKLPASGVTGVRCTNCSLSHCAGLLRTSTHEKTSFQIKNTLGRCLSRDEFKCFYAVLRLRYKSPAPKGSSSLFECQAHRGHCRTNKSSKSLEARQRAEPFLVSPGSFSPPVFPSCPPDPNQPLLQKRPGQRPTAQTPGGHTSAPVLLRHGQS